MLQEKPDNKDAWKSWSTSLRRWGLQEVVAQILVSGGSLNVFFAQLIYICQPFLKNSLPPGHFQMLADVLEDNDKAMAFGAYLREGENS